MTRRTGSPTPALVTVVLAGCGQGGLDPRGPRAARIHDVTTVLTIVAMVVALVAVVVWVQAIMSPAHPDLSEASVDHLGESGEAPSSAAFSMPG